MCQAGAGPATGEQSQQHILSVVVKQWSGFRRQQIFGGPVVGGSFSTVSQLGAEVHRICTYPIQTCGFRHCGDQVVDNESGLISALG